MGGSRFISYPWDRCSLIGMGGITAYVIYIVSLPLSAKNLKLNVLKLNVCIMRFHSITRHDDTDKAELLVESQTQAVPWFEIYLN